MILSARGRGTGKEQEQLKEANQELREDNCYLLTDIVIFNVVISIL